MAKQNKLKRYPYIHKDSLNLWHLTVNGNVEFQFKNKHEMLDKIIELYGR